MGFGRGSFDSAVVGLRGVEESHFDGCGLLLEVGDNMYVIVLKLVL